MKTAELFEAKVMPEWARDEELAFRSMLRRFGFTIRKRPVFYKSRWIFGGPVVDIDKDRTVSVENRIAALRRIVAKHLFSLKEAGREVVILAPERYGHVASGGYVHWQIVDFTPKQVYPGDSLSHVESLVKDRLFLNYRSGDEKKHITFQYGLSETPAKEEPKPAPKAVRVVKGTK